MRSWIENTLRRVGERTRIPFAVRYPEGAEQRTTDATPAFTLVFRNARAYWRMAAFGYVGLLEAYFDGEVDIEGSLAKALAAGMEGGIDQRGTPFTWIRNRWHELVHPTPSAAQAQRNANFHYALHARVLQAVARRPADALHLRVLEGRHAHAGGGAAQQVRPRGAEAAAQAGRGGGRRRQRLRRLHVPRARALRRQGYRHQHHRLAGRARAPRDRAPAPGQFAADARRLPRRRARVRQGGLASAAWSTPGATSSPS